MNKKKLESSASAPPSAPEIVVPPFDPSRPIEDVNTAAPATAAAGKFKIYIVYSYRSDVNKKTQKGYLILNTDFPDIETEAHLVVCYNFIIKRTGRDNLVIESWRALEVEKGKGNAP